MSMNDNEKRENKKKAAKVLMEMQKNQKRVGSMSGGESNENGETNGLEASVYGVISTKSGGCV
jgi:hypothetical protein